MGLRISLLVLFCLFPIQNQALAEDRNIGDLDEVAAVVNSLEAQSAVTSHSTKNESLGNSLHELKECLMAATCVRCLGSLEPDCVEFNLGHWAWCLNPLNSVLLKCASSL